MLTSSKSSGLGGVTRDANGDVYVSFSCKVSHIFNPEVAEALTLRKVMFLYGDLGFHFMIFEGDRLSAVNMINSISIPFAYARPITFDI